MEITGAIILGSADRASGAAFAAIDPATGQKIGPDFHEAGAADVADAAALADEAFAAFGESDLDTRARFLEAIAEEIANIGDALIERAIRESGLPRARLEGERERGERLEPLLRAAIHRLGAGFDTCVDHRLSQRCVDAGRRPR